MKTLLRYGFTKEDYNKAKDSVDEASLKNILGLILVMIVVLAVYILTTLIFNYFSLSTLIFFAALLLVAILSKFLLKKVIKKYKVIEVDVLLIILYSLGIALASMTTSTGNSVTIIVFFTFLPLVRANRLIRTIFMELFFLGAFIVVDTHIKAGRVLYVDMINAVTFSLLGLIFHYISALNIIKGKLFEFKNAAALSQLEIEKSAAMQIAESKAQFLSNMSHDIRTPLNAVIGLTDLALIEIHQKESLEYFFKIKNAGKYLLAVLNEVLEMAKIQNGNVFIKETTKSTKKFLAEIYDVIAPQAEKKGITFVINHENIGYDYLNFDVVHVEQILINILNNAVKYTKPGGRVSFSTESKLLNNTMVLVTYRIEDTGIGMSASFMDRLYECFQREENELSESEGGTGLGLSIAKNLIDLMAGKIRCTSEREVGTSFTIELPAHIALQKDIEKLEVESTEENIYFQKNATILLAEDNEINAEIATKILENEGFSVIWRKNGQETIDYIADSENDEVSAILMDARMPIMNGLESTTAIRSLPGIYAKKLPIIGLSANAFEEDIESAKAAGMNDYLTKPIIVRDLKEVLKKFL